MTNRYLVTMEGDPFFVSEFDTDYHFMPEFDMMVYDLETLLYTKDGINWIPIKCFL